MGTTKIGKGGKYGDYPGEGEIVSIDLEKQTAANLFLALAQALHYPTGKKKGKKGKNGKKGTKPGNGKGAKVYTRTTGAPGYTATGAKGPKGYAATTGAPGFTGTGTKGTKGSTGTKGQERQRRDRKRKRQ